MSEGPFGAGPRALLIGYGNPYRSDDGVARHVLNIVRERWGLPPLALDESGEDQLGRAVDTLMLHQLLPELAPLLADYDRVIFVDAHAGAIPEEVRVAPVAEEQGFQAVVHHMTPGHLLHYTRMAAGGAPRAWLVSILGERFDFGENLTEPCRARAAAAAEDILRLLG